MTIPLIDASLLVALVLVAAGAWREGRRADRVEATLRALNTRLDADYVPRATYEESALARRLLEDSLREGFLPALQEALIANGDSLDLIRRYQFENEQGNRDRESAP